MRARRLFTLAFVIGLAPSLGACGRNADVDDETAAPPAIERSTDQAVRVTDVELGRSIDAQGRIADGADTDDFARNETIYVSVSTDGAAAGSRLTARWTFEDGQVVDESSQTLSATGPASARPRPGRGARPMWCAIAAQPRRPADLRRSGAAGLFVADVSPPP
jgi:hypothetical protein